MRFQGFTDETFEFFMAIGFNNNREFFHANHDWYMRAVRDPCMYLAEDLGDIVLSLDDQIDTRPNKAVSRINRDLRFSKGKSPYRDYMWLHFRRPDENKDTTMGAYFDIGADGAHAGVGVYADNKPLFNALRNRLMVNKSEFTAVLPHSGELHLNTIKRMAVPESIDEELTGWYKARSFYIEKDLSDFELLKSPKLVDAIRDVYEEYKPIYKFFNALTPTNVLPEI